MTDPHWLDSDEYPTEAALARIETWPGDDAAGCLAFVKDLWHWGGWGWTEGASTENAFGQRRPSRLYLISTGGWSGNESLIGALKRNFPIWALSWVSTRRGGHYELRVEE